MTKSSSDPGAEPASRFVVYPVKLISRRGKHWQRGKLDFFRDAKPVARAFGISGRRPPIFVKTFHATSLPPKAKSAFLYRHPTAGLLVLIEWNVPLLTKMERDEIDLPNRLSVSLLLKALGLKPNAPLVTKTISATYPGVSKELTWVEKNLHIPQSHSDFVVEQSATRLLMAIGIERAMVDHASGFLVSRFRPNVVARQHLASLLGWISNLAIDNDETRSAYQEARQNLQLDERRTELVEALKAITDGNSQAVVAGFTVGGTLVAVSATGLTFGLDPTIFGYCGLAVGILTWSIAKFTR